MNLDTNWMPFLDLGDTLHIVVSSLLAFVLGLFVAWIYRLTHRGVSYSHELINTLVITATLINLVMLIIGGNLARAFGLVGVMSMVRFRTSLRDVRDAIFIFYALAAGMATGTGNEVIGVAGILVIGLLVLMLHWSGHGMPRRAEGGLLQFNAPLDGESRKPYLPVFEKYLNSSSLLHVRAIPQAELLELSFHVALKDRTQMENFVSALSAVDGLDRVNVVIGEGEMPGVM